jgi:mRNA interferase MazF
MKLGEIVLVKFPFSDLETAKKRPALVLIETKISKDIRVVTIAMVTSRIEGASLSGDYQIQKWSEAGLFHPSLIRFSKVATVEIELVEKPLGQLAVTDLKGAKTAFKKHFQAWV